MKKLVAYYSRTGNNEKIAKLLQSRLKCDIEILYSTALMRWLKVEYEMIKDG